MSSPPQPGPGGVYQGGEYGSGAQPPGAQPQQPAGQPPFQPPAPGFPPPQQPPGPGFPPPQQPPPGGQFQVPQQFPPGGAPPPEKKKRGKLAIVGGVLAAIAIAVVVRVVIGSVLGGDDVPEVGDCVNNPSDPNDIEVVDCGSGDAVYEVIGLDGQMSESEFNAVSNEEVCTSFPNWEQAIWYSTSGSSGEVVCVVTNG